MIGAIYCIVSGLAAATVTALIWSTPTAYTWIAIGWLACVAIHEIGDRTA